MSFKFQDSSFQRGASALLLLALCHTAGAGDLTALVRDRTAVERVYYSHRLGEKPPFEQVLPPSLIERLVRTDLTKEAALKNAYGVEVTSAMLAAEVQRITTTTRAPEILAELKAALGDDTNRFARSVAKPIVVERLLRQRFENDDALHAAQRREAEKIRERLLAARGSRREEALTQKAEATATNSFVRELVAILKAVHSNAVTETTWKFGARRPDTNAPTADEIEIKKRFGPDAQILSSARGGEKDHRFYFEDLPGELQRVLRVQLRQPRDVSAVIETPNGFLLYVCTERTPEILSAATLSVPKQSYEEWLAEHNGGTE